MVNKYKGFNKNLMKKDLNKEELRCYNILMNNIKGHSEKEKGEVTHLMNVFVEADEKVHVKCARCGKDFEDKNSDNKNIYCNKCLNKMWS